MSDASLSFRSAESSVTGTVCTCCIPRWMNVVTSSNFNRRSRITYMDDRFTPACFAHNQ